MNTRLLLLAALCAGSVLRAQPPSKPRPQSAATTQTATLTVSDALAAIQKLIDQLLSSSASAAERDAYGAQTEWLRSVHKRLSDVADPAATSVAPRDRATGMALGRTARDQATGQASGRRASEASPGQASGARMDASDKAIGDLKSAIELEARKFQTLSNASKARHDMAMSSIRNLK